MAKPGMAMIGKAWTNKKEDFMNKVILTGRLVRPPEIRTTQSGKIVAGFTLAVERPRSRNKETDFIGIVAWEKLGEICGNNLDKGRKCMVEGHLQIRSYEAKDGTKRWVAEVVAETVEFLDGKRDPSAADNPSKSGPITDAGQFGHDVAPDDEIPF